MRTLLLLLLVSGCAAAPPSASAPAQARTPTEIPAVDTTLSVAEQSARFLAAVAELPNVQRGRDGVMWTVEQDGSGMRPTRSEAVLAQYIGRLADGTVFDASQEPTRLPVRGVVQGLQDVLQDMRPGERRTIYIPADQAYGARGVPGVGGTYRVPPNAALVFDLTVVRVTR